MVESHETMATLLIFLSLVVFATSAAPSEKELIKFLNTEYEVQANVWCTKSQVASWNYNTDITPEHSQRNQEVTLEKAKFDKDTYEKWFKDVKIDDIKDRKYKRMFKTLAIQGTAALSKADLKTLTETKSRMTDVYSTASVCPFKKDNCEKEEKMELERDIEPILAKVEDYDQMLDLWTKWHDATGKKIRDHYRIYVELSNKMAKANKFADYGKYWQDSFETDDFVRKIDEIWTEVEPLYKSLHKYAGKKLKAKFSKINSPGNYLPAHVFGNMWAQSWSNLEKVMTPYPDESPVDVTKALNDQNYTVEKMFETSNKFYLDLGLPSNAMSYGPGSMITQPIGKKVTCHASAWDFCNKKTYFIKMCTQINQDDFITVHHEMGHIQYFILYHNQPHVFRTGANPGFHEAVGDTISLSVQSIPHLKKIGLVASDYKESEKADINALMNMALEKVAFLPFGLLIDKWRWDVFAGVVPESEWNTHWWRLREKYQGITSPTPRNESYFDPGAKYHIPANSQYISYFVSRILQFQFYRGLCIAAGQYDPVKRDKPLYQCDFDGNKKAGALLKNALSLGKSEHWPEALEILAGTRNLSASALLEYFEPLQQFFAEDEKNSSSIVLPSLLTMTLMVVLQWF